MKEKINQKNIFVTGCAGFIGFHICKALIKRGDMVVGVDNLNHYYDIKLKKNRLKALTIISKKSKSSFIFKKTDITNKKELSKIFKRFKFDRVIHLAAQAGVRYSLKNPDTYIKTNQMGFFNVIDLTKNHKIPHILYASSSSVYGENKKTPYKETDNTDHPKQIYAATKKSNEILAYSYSSLYNLKTTGLRYFTVYGPWGRPDMALFKFTKNIIENKKLEVFNYGKHLRDFTYIDDVVNLTLLASDNISNFKKHKTLSRIFNVGNNSPISLQKFIKIIEKTLEVKSKQKNFPLQKGDMISTYSDSSKVFKKFSYSIKTNHQQNVLEFVNWYKNYYLKK
jgi:UDP-glucuronate 4-epimerase